MATRRRRVTVYLTPVVLAALALGLAALAPPCRPSPDGACDFSVVRELAALCFLLTLVALAAAILVFVLNLVGAFRH